MARLLELLADRQVQQVLLVLHLLRAGCLGKVEAAVVEALLARVVLAVLEVAAQVAVVARVAAAHTRPALVA